MLNGMSAKSQPRTFPEVDLVAFEIAAMGIDRPASVES